MKPELRRDVHVGEAVAIGQHERAIPAKPWPETFHAAAGLGVDARIDQVDFPVARAQGLRSNDLGPD